MASISRSGSATNFNSGAARALPAQRSEAASIPLPTGEVERDRLRDLTALALLAACAFVIAALLTFDPADPPVPSMFPPHARATNACGFVGSLVAGSLYQWLGLGAWFVLGLVVALDLMMLKRRSLADLPLRALGAVVATLSICTLLAMFLPAGVGRPVWGPGGLVGATGALFAESYVARAGAAIVVTGIGLAGLFVACDALLIATAAAALATGAYVLAGASRLADGTRQTIGWMLPSSSAARAAESLDSAAAEPALDFLTRIRRARAEANDDDEADSTFEQTQAHVAPEPTIRLRRRDAAPRAETAAEAAIPVAAPAAAKVAKLAAVDADEFADDDLADSHEEEESEFSSEEEFEPAGPVAVPLPIRSQMSRRRSVDVVDIAPDPLANYELPSLELLLPSEQLETEAQEQEVRERAKVLEKTFADFGFRVKVVEVETGPVISQYEIELEAGLRLAKISNLADDIAIALRVPSVRIVAPIPGKNSVGIEVPNTDRQMVRLREVIEETQAKARTMKVPIFLGKDVAGNPMVVDMASMPHLLIAGRTGTGKSVCLNSLIVSILMTRRPDEVRMLMIDPKMVELTPYKSLPHLMHPVVTDMKKAEAILAWAVDKMEERYAMLARVGVRHLSQYNQLGRDELLKRMRPETDEEAAAIPTTMPSIVMIADEIADMMMTAGKEIEGHIIRLAQKSRAVGIHLVLATQKPTVDVITGLIKSNLPARIAFQVASRTDSRVVLDECGAERLLGNGDMLFLSPGTSQILRGQGTYLSDDEIGRVMAAIGTTEPQYAAELVNLQPAPSADAPKGVSPKERDDMYEAAVEVVIREGRGSVSLLQRALGVGYGRGARLIDFMAEDGVVGQYAGSQAREVLLTLEQWAARNGTAALPADPVPRRLKIQPHAGPAEPPAAKAKRPAAARKIAPVIEEVAEDDSEPNADEEADEELSFVVDDEATSAEFRALARGADDEEEEEEEEDESGEDDDEDDLDEEMDEDQDEPEESEYDEEASRVG